jgi:hypothetical protein
MPALAVMAACVYCQGDVAHSVKLLKFSWLFFLCSAVNWTTSLSEQRNALTSRKWLTETHQIHVQAHVVKTGLMARPWRHALRSGHISL